LEAMTSLRSCGHHAKK